MSVPAASTGGFSPVSRAWFTLPVLLGAALILTNRWFTFVDDECKIIDRAALPIRQIVAALFSEHFEVWEHPPLSDAILHGWLRLTGGQFELLRLPSIVFYVIGAVLLAKACSRIAGPGGLFWSLVLTTLWPYGFHIGRLAGWYSWSFMLIAGLTLAYLKWADDPAPRRLLWVVVWSMLLVYSNYFGWPILAFLGLDFLLRDRGNLLRYSRQLFAAAAILLVGYLPMFPIMFRMFGQGGLHRNSLLAIAFAGIYNLYCVFVSESVAPWFWVLGIPAGVAVAIGLLIVLFCGPLVARRFLLYFAALLALMAAAGIAEDKRMIVLGPWLILSFATTVARLEHRPLRRVLIAGLVIAASIGWYGIFARNLYAAPHWTEPWAQVSDQAAQVVRNGGLVIGDNTSFFFYLTYSLPPPKAPKKMEFAGLLPGSTTREGAYAPTQWLYAGSPLRPTVLIVEGVHFGLSEELEDQVEPYLNTRCSEQTERKLVPDPAADLKRHYAPASGTLPWRIDLKTYSCR